MPLKLKKVYYNNFHLICITSRLRAEQTEHFSFKVPTTKTRTSLEIYDIIIKTI